MDTRSTQSHTEMKSNATASALTAMQMEPFTIVNPSVSELALQPHRDTIFGMRTAGEDIFVDPRDGIIKPLKTSILIDEAKLPLTEANPNLLTRIRSHRPAIEISGISRSHSPVAVRTPTLSELPRVAAFGAFSIFSNAPDLNPVIDDRVVTQINDDNSFFDSVAFEAVREPKGTSKKQEATITYTQLDERRKEAIQRHNRRIRSQNKAMVKTGVGERKASATDYVRSTELFSNDLKWEWLHLVAHMILGDASQTHDHLVAGTAFANTDMMFAEENLNYLSRVYPRGFKLVAKASLIPGLQIATTIDYCIQTSDFEIPLRFNAQNANRPHLYYRDYFDFIFREVVRLSKQKNIQSPAEEPLDQLLTYNKSELMDRELPVFTQDKPPQTKTTFPSTVPQPQTIIAIDTETTGLHHHSGDRIVQIGAIEYDLEGKATGRTFSQVINPGRPIPKMLKEKGIHNTTDETVRDKPDFRSIAPKLIQFITKTNARLVAHNANFDFTFLEHELKLAGSSASLIGMHAIDTLAEARAALPLEENAALASHKLSEVCEHLGLDISARSAGHDAVVDARLAGNLHFRLQERNAGLASSSSSSSSSSSLSLSTLFSGRTTRSQTQAAPSSASEKITSLSKKRKNPPEETDQEEKRKSTHRH